MSDHDAGLRVVQDVRQLRRSEADVQVDEHEAPGRRRKMRFHHSLRVGRQDGDAASRLQASAGKRAGEAQRAREEVAVGDAPLSAVRATAGDGHGALVPDQRLDQEGEGVGLEPRARGLRLGSVLRVAGDLALPAGGIRAGVAEARSQNRVGEAL